VESAERQVLCKVTFTYTQEFFARQTSSTHFAPVATAWVETVLVFTLKQANEQMDGSGKALRLDPNLDRRSTNHPHCEF
jgi:hypothetical protein